jgi:hypothetical protein
VAPAARGGQGADGRGWGAVPGRGPDVAVAAGFSARPWPQALDGK